MRQLRALLGRFDDFQEQQVEANFKMSPREDKSSDRRIKLFVMGEKIPRSRTSAGC